MNRLPSEPVGRRQAILRGLVGLPILGTLIAGLSGAGCTSTHNTARRTSRRTSRRTTRRRTY